MQDEQLQEIKIIKKEYDSKYDKLQFNHSQEFNQYKEKIEIEKEQWISIQLSKQQEQLDKYKNDLKKQLTIERDQQIEDVLNKLSEENYNLEEDSYKKYQQMQQQQDDKYQVEIKSKNKEIKILEEKYDLQIDKHNQLEQKIDLLKQQNQQELDLISQKLINNQNQIENKQKIIDELKIKISELQQDNDHLQEIQKIFDKRLKQSIEQNTNEYCDEIMKLKQNINELKNDHQYEVSQMEEKHIHQLEDVEQRVKKAILKKESEIVKLREEVKFHESKQLKYEQLLEKQRKDLLNK